MASEQDPENEVMDSTDEEIVQRLDEIDGTLLDHFENDARLQSGVPEGQRTSDLDFIQMSGLTRPQPQTAKSADPADLDPSKPLSFFERGVADVDAAMVPPDIVEGHDSDLIPSAPAQPARSYLMTPVPGTSPSPIDVEDALSDIEAANLASAEIEAAEMRTPRAPDLEEAEQLLQALEAQPREVPTAPRAPVSEPPVPPAPPQPIQHEISEAVTVAGPAPAAPPPVRAELAPTAVAPPVQAEAPAERADGFNYPMAVDMEPESEGDSESDDGEFTERDATVYSKPMPGKHTRRSHGANPHSWRRILRLVRRVVVLLAIVAIVVAVSLQMRKRMEPPSQTLTAAQQFRKEHKYREASQAFAAFATDNREDPRRAEAQFQAAYCLQQVKTDSIDDQNALKARALELYKQFVTDNPAHEKTPRAKTLMGLLLCDLKSFKEAVEILQDPELPLADPDGALPALRALARARIEMNDFEGAASAYLQAAALSSNYAPDDDYSALAVMYSQLSEKTSDEAERKKYQRLAAEKLTDAIRMPTLDPSRRNDLKSKRDYFLSQAGEQVPTAEEEAAQAAQAAKASVFGREAKPTSPTPQPTKAETPKTESAKAEPAKAEPAKAEPAKAEPAKAEPAKAEPQKPEPQKPGENKAPDPHLEAQYPGTK